MSTADRCGERFAIGLSLTRDRLILKNETIVQRGHQPAGVGIAREVEPQGDALGDLRSEMEQPFSPSGLRDGELEVAFDDVVEQAKGSDEV